jgi:hypothetical protein
LTWQPLGLLTTVKPPALRERHDSQIFRKELEKGVAWLVEKENLLEDELPKPDLSKLESAKKPQRINWWLVTHWSSKSTALGQIESVVTCLLRIEPDAA